MLGTTDELPEVLEDVEPDEVLIAIPSAPGELRARVVSACRARGVPVRTIPTVTRPYRVVTFSEAIGPSKPAGPATLEQK